MEAYSHIKLSRTGTEIMLRMTALEVLQLAANKAGFFDVDLVDNEPGHVKVVATAPNRTVTAKGSDIKTAVEKFLNIVFVEK